MVGLRLVSLLRNMQLPNLSEIKLKSSKSLECTEQEKEAELSASFYRRVGRVGIEPTWFEPGDFKSPASANSATAPNSAVALIVHSMQGRSRLNYFDLIKKGYLRVGVYIPA